MSRPVAFSKCKPLVAQVLSSPDLLLMILPQVEERTLLRSRRVCTLFNTIINGSKSLQRHLGYLPRLRKPNERVTTPILNRLVFHKNRDKMQLHNKLCQWELTYTLDWCNIRRRQGTSFMDGWRLYIAARWDPLTRPIPDEATRTRALQQSFMDILITGTIVRVDCEIDRVVPEEIKQIRESQPIRTCRDMYRCLLDWEVEHADALQQYVREYRRLPNGNEARREDAQVGPSRGGATVRRRRTNGRARGGWRSVGGTGGRRGRGR